MVEDIDSQKGTMGIAYKQSDMPFTTKGIAPDICINPCAIPSRMTIGQLIEAVVGKASAIDGTFADGTPFSKIDIESVKNKLEELGEDRIGCEYLYNGMTGVKMKSKIFICPTYYGRLKHDVYACKFRIHTVFVIRQRYCKSVYTLATKSNCGNSHRFVKIKKLKV